MVSHVPAASSCLLPRDNMTPLEPNLFLLRCPPQGQHFLPHAVLLQPYPRTLPLPLDKWFLFKTHPLRRYPPFLVLEVYAAERHGTATFLRGLALTDFRSFCARVTMSNWESLVKSAHGSQLHGGPCSGSARSGQVMQ